MYLFCVQQILADYTTSTETPAGLDRPDLKRSAPNQLQTNHTRIFPFVNATWTGSRLLSGTRHWRTVTSRTILERKKFAHAHTLCGQDLHISTSLSPTCLHSFSENNVAVPPQQAAWAVFNLPAPLLTRAARICAAPHPNRAPVNATPHRGHQLSRALTSPGRGSNQYAEGI